MRYVIAATIYLIGAFLTGGYYANHRCSAYQEASNICGFDATLTGMLWPLYWSGRASLEVTK